MSYDTSGVGTCRGHISRNTHAFDGQEIRALHLADKTRGIDTTINRTRYMQVAKGGLTRHIAEGGAGAAIAAVDVDGQRMAFAVEGAAVRSRLVESDTLCHRDVGIQTGVHIYQSLSDIHKVAELIPLFSGADVENVRRLFFR